MVKSIKKISTNINRKFKFDPNSSENFGRFRINDPKIFLRMWTRQDAIHKGISYIVGLTKNKDFSVQSVRFNKNIWNEKSATKWWKTNKKRFVKYKKKIRKNPLNERVFEKELEFLTPIILE